MGLPRYLVEKKDELLENYLEAIRFYIKNTYRHQMHEAHYDVFIKNFLDYDAELKRYKDCNYLRNLEHKAIHEIKDKYQLFEKPYEFKKCNVKLVKKVTVERNDKNEITVYDYCVLKKILFPEGDITNMQYSEKGEMHYYPNNLRKKKDAYIRIVRMVNNLKKKYQYQNKVYPNRTFPVSLRNIIFDRDNYQCKICGIHRDSLPKDKHLEVDHILAWQDGGQTTLSNGQTVCSDCNKGKHHSKKYLNLIKGGK